MIQNQEEPKEKIFNIGLTELEIIRRINLLYGLKSTQAFLEVQEGAINVDEINKLKSLITPKEAGQ